MMLVTEKPAASYALNAVCRLQVSALSAAGIPSESVQTGLLPLPTELVICPWGESRDLSGERVFVGDVTLQVLAANQAQYGFEEIALDFQHNTTPKFDADGNPIRLAEPVPIAAMGCLRVEAGRGIIFTPLSWSPDGEKAYTNRWFRDLSPTIARDEAGNVTFVHSCALTRNGQISDLHAFSSPSPITSSKPTTRKMDYRALLLNLLGLAADATDEMIVSAADEKTKAKPTEIAMPETEDMSARMDRLERQQIVSAATALGKVIPLSDADVNRTPIPVLRSLCAALPATVAMGGGQRSAADPPQVKALSAEEKIVCKQLGISEEEFRKQNPA